MANVDDRLAVRPAGVREQDLRKRFQSDRVESVKRQTLIPPLTWMTGIPRGFRVTG
jgi:hypothetical protein